MKNATIRCPYECVAQSLTRLTAYSVAWYVVPLVLPVTLIGVPEDVDADSLSPADPLLVTVTPVELVTSDDVLPGLVDGKPGELLDEVGMPDPLPVPEVLDVQAAASAATSAATAITHRYLFTPTPEQMVGESR